jgi:hypothetical protein
LFKSFRDKIAVSGIAVLGVGIALLIFTFISAYGFLAAGLSIIASDDLVKTFGTALAPLIGTCIRVMYLGVMGWIGSLITIRGVTIIAHVPPAQTTLAHQTAITTQASLTSTTQQKQQPQPQKQKQEKPKETTKPQAVPEPEIIVIPPEQMIQPAQTTQIQTQKENQ